MTNPREIAAIILSAGYSSRMGRFKPLLPLGDNTVLERSVHLFRGAGIQDIEVVVGYRSDELIPLLRKLGAKWTVNESFQEGMFSSIQAGVNSMEASKKAFFLLPVDIPLVRRSTVTDLLQSLAKCDADVLYPCFLGKRGHPPLISATLRSDILSWDKEGGLRECLQQHQGRSVNVEVADEHVLLDMDSEEQYEDICNRLPCYAIPSYDECMVILKVKAAASEGLVAHSNRVAQVAACLSNELNASGSRLNTKLVTAGALLHDMAKGSRNHASVAAQILDEMGYPEVANLVGCHMDTDTAEGRTISERDVVCIADRLVQRDRVVRLEERYEQKLVECAGDAGACAAISSRLDGSLRLKRRVELQVGTTIDSLLRIGAKEDNG